MQSPPFPAPEPAAGSSKWRVFLVLLLASAATLYVVHQQLTADAIPLLQGPRVRQDERFPLQPEHALHVSTLLHNSTTTTTTTSTRPAVTASRVHGHATQPAGPVTALLLTYNRCGSSFIGNIFNQNPDAFYVYEPLDAVFAHLYGTKLGWNVGSDITHHSDLTRRELPKHELMGMADAIQGLLECKLSALWPEVLYNDFWVQFAKYHAVPAYISCLKRHGASPRACSKYTNRACGMNFDPEKTPNRCYKDLMLGSTSTAHSAVEQYKRCMRKVADKGRPCLPLLQEKCTGARGLRSTKTVRASMDVAEVLLTRMPQLKVVHLVRDPRAVAHSRRTEASFRSMYSVTKTAPSRKKPVYDYVREGKLICDSMDQDRVKAEQLSRRFPGRVTQLVFEEFVQDPLAGTASIYKFLGTDVPSTVADWLSQHTGKSEAIATNWMDAVKQSSAEEVRRSNMCEPLYRNMSKYWT